IAKRAARMGSPLTTMWQEGALAGRTPLWGAGAGTGRVAMALLRRAVGRVVVARHVWGPGPRGATRVVLSFPDRQPLGGGQAKAVGSTHVVEELAHQHRRRLMLGIPGLGGNDVLHAGQLVLPVPHLVQQRLRPVRVEGAVAYEVPVGEVNAHRPLLRPADAAV